MTSMKGILWKWTNYWMGWQPRWFILADGILSYYNSEEEVRLGCKGSISVAACSLNVHSTDHLRLDIVIPGEKYIYVKAATPTERTQWLVALGNAKAQGLDLMRKRKTSSGDDTVPPNEDVIKVKKSELRLYCDLLVQQVHSIKEASTLPTGPDINKLEESTKNLTTTCNTFINTLEDCVLLTNAVHRNNLHDSSLQPLVPQNPNTSNNQRNNRKEKTFQHSNSNNSN